MASGAGGCADAPPAAARLTASSSKRGEDVGRLGMDPTLSSQTVASDRVPDGSQLGAVSGDFAGAPGSSTPARWYSFSLYWILRALMSRTSAARDVLPETDSSVRR